MIQIEQ